MLPQFRQQGQEVKEKSKNTLLKLHVFALVLPTEGPATTPLIFGGVFFLFCDLVKALFAGAPVDRMPSSCQQCQLSHDRGVCSSWRRILSGGVEGYFQHVTRPIGFFSSERDNSPLVVAIGFAVTGGWNWERGKGQDAENRRKKQESSLLLKLSPVLHDVAWHPGTRNKAAADWTERSGRTQRDGEDPDNEPDKR